jgi:hypothetical protein
MEIKNTQVLKYEEFITDENQVFQFECDMEEGKYQHWVDQYPEHILSIFGSLLEYYGNFVNEEDIIFFLNNGVVLNVVTNAYRCESGYTTALIYACEHRYKRLIEYLIKYGAYVDKKDKTNTTPLESVLMGHGMRDLSKIEETEECVKILLEAGAKNELRRFILEDYCEEYLEKSEYLKSILENAVIVD